jgi:hypothetical protein
VRTDRCPICNVAVKPENLLRHLNDTHPRHPDTPRLREQLKTELGPAVRRRAAAPIRVQRWQVALVTLVVLGGVGVYYALPYFSPGENQPFPCVVGINYVYHWHTLLTIYSGGVQFTIPANVGITAGCLEPVHTHDTTGRIHIETTVNRLYSIGDFYIVWGRSFDTPTQMLVNGSAVSPSPSVTLYDQEMISIYYASFG